MKRTLLYIIVGVIAGAILLMLYTSNNGDDQNRRLDERESFSRRDKIPYGLQVAYNGLSELFPEAAVSVNRKEPGMWDNLSLTGSAQALVIISPTFNADEYEFKQLLRFIENGNQVMVSTRVLSADVEKAIAAYSNSNDINLYVPFNLGKDTLEVDLGPGFFDDTASFSYPGKRFDGHFNSIDSFRALVTGHDDAGIPNFIQLRAGKGSMWIHLAPMAFTNYFLLHRQNLAFYEKMLSLIPANTTRVAWDEYYLNKRDDVRRQKPGKNWLSVLMNLENAAGKKPFRAAIWMLLFLLLLYVLMEMRRKQRQIPVIRKPVNESMEFAKTIGRLYHDKGDHNNLARKMAAYFLEHIRTRYKLSTTELDEAFILNLQYKTGADEALLKDIIYTIQTLDSAPMSEKDLAQFHKKLELFYKTA